MRCLGYAQNFGVGIQSHARHWLAMGTQPREFRVDSRTVVATLRRAEEGEDDDLPRLIERAFPLKQTSLDSVHEKNVRHGHISTLHIWPARRPLAACRAALIATLLPDPGTPEERQKLCERIGGKVVEKIEKKKMPNGRTVERIKEETEGGILHWLGSEPTSGGKKKQEEYRHKAKFYEEELEWFRQEIRKAYGGRAPRVLDPFAGGGAIPLEAMRLGCEVTAADINPVAWFILKCTLEYPQKLAGKTHPLPDFILDDEEFMAAFYKAHPDLTLKAKRSNKIGETKGLFEQKGLPAPAADLAWHVRAWGQVGIESCSSGSGAVLSDLCGLRAAQARQGLREAAYAARAAQRRRHGGHRLVKR